MKTAKQWALELPPDVLEHPMPFPARLDYAEAIIKRAQDDARTVDQKTYEQNIAIWQRWYAEMVDTSDKLKRALQRIVDYPVHSEPVGCAYAMQDIAREAIAGLSDK